MKHNMGYKRFRHFGKDKTTMDFAFLAIAFNIKEMAATLRKQGNMPTDGGQPGQLESSYTHILALLRPNKEILNCRIDAAKLARLT